MVSDISNEIEKENRLYKNKYNMSPYEINHGSCLDFAYRVARKIETAEVLKSWEYYDNCTTIHVWVKYNEKHYDSEKPKGVDKAELLPVFKRNGI